jgi:MoaA/NifB/PqqE/SkfB family radical SAM enzyme
MREWPADWRAKVKAELLKRKRFCAVPWTHLSSRPNGDFRLCCRVQSKKIKIGDRHAKWTTTDIRRVWTSEYMREIRQAMLEDKVLPECTYCYKDEEAGHRSLRQLKNELFEKEIYKILNEPGYARHLPLEVDLKLGNECNLGCIMCWPSSSSKVAGQVKSVLAEGFRDARLEEDYTTARTMVRWGDAGDAYFDNLFKLRDYIHGLYVTGGEPLANREFMKFIDTLIEAGRAPKIDLEMSTNLILMTPEMLDKFLCFKTFCPNISLDAVGPAYDYIRHPGRWEQLAQKIEWLQSRRALFNLCFTYSVYSIFEVLPFLRWVKTTGIPLARVGFLSLFEPRFLEVSQLPTVAKTEMRREFEAYLLHEPQAAELVRPLLKHMDSQEADPALIAKCGEYTRLRDRARGTDMQRGLPRFAAFYGSR